MPRIATWNVRRARASSKCWDLLESINPDLALLQEVGAIPDRLHRRYQIAASTPTRKSGTPHKFKTAILVRGEIIGELELVSELDWINRERAWFGGNITARKIVLCGSRVVNVISFYSPAWPVDPGRLTGIDVQEVQLANNPSIWCTEILWSLLAGSMKGGAEPWIVGGDFNSSETFDASRRGGRGNREIMDRLNALGLHECLRTHEGRLVPTFRNPRGGAVIHQIDHLYVSKVLLAQMLSCGVAARELVFGQGLSDHLPVVADFQTD